MPNSIAFFPWVNLRKALSDGPLRFIPYKCGSLPGDTAYVSQRDIDEIFCAYAHRKNQVVKQACLVEIGDWSIGQYSDERVNEELFRSRELIAFAALAKRRLFRGHMDYCNFDTYAFVVQNYNVGESRAFSFSTRRRDGGAQHLWHTNEFAFLRPLHVETNSNFSLDEALLAALLKADKANKLPYEAIVEFNRANTDSQDVPIHTEVVLVKSAFEYFFGVGEKANEFVDALRGVLPPAESQVEFDGPLKERWQESRPKATRTIEAWAREFCDIRGGAAHGTKRGGSRFVLLEDAHLAFASLLFPLLIKRRLSLDGFLEISERDAIELERIEAYLMHDPFKPLDPDEKAHEHSWNQVYDDVVLGESLRRALLRQMQASNWNALPPEY